MIVQREERTCMECSVILKPYLGEKMEGGRGNWTLNQVVPGVHTQFSVLCDCCCA